MVNPRGTQIATPTYPQLQPRGGAFSRLELQGETDRASLLTKQDSLRVELLQ